MISVIIPTLNAEKNIKELIGRLSSQSERPDEIIIIDSSSDDDTVPLARSLGADVITIRREEFDHGGTRNLGAKEAGGDILIFLTQDAKPANNKTIEYLIAPLNKPEIAASYARQIPSADATPLERFARHFNYPPISIEKGKPDIPRFGIKTFFFSNVFSSFRRKEFEIIGGFPEKTIMNEDLIMAAELILRGHIIAYASESRVIHSHNYSWPQQFKRYFDIGVAFNRQRWMLEGVKTESEGWRYLKEEFKYLTKSNNLFWIPAACLEAAIKYSAYHLGLLEDNIPTTLKKRMSMHRHYWQH